MQRSMSRSIPRFGQSTWESRICSCMSEGCVIDLPRASVVARMRRRKLRTPVRLFRRMHQAKLVPVKARVLVLGAGFGGLELATAHTNSQAQKLYESLGYELDREFRRYELRV